MQAALPSRSSNRARARKSSPGSSNAYTGTTTINGGALEIDGSIATSSLISVNAMGTLDGIGTVGKTQRQFRWHLRAGQRTRPEPTRPSTARSAWRAAAFYLVQVNPATPSYSAVTGTATLSGATVEAAFALVSGYVSKQYTILTATGGLTSTTFAGLANANLPSGATDSLSYSTNDDDVYLNLVAPFTNYAGLNGNQQTVANALTTDYNANGGTLPKFCDHLQLDRPLDRFRRSMAKPRPARRRAHSS